MKKIFKQLLSASIFILSLTALRAQQSIYSFEKKIALPGNSGYDYLSIDTINKHLFVSHGTSVNVIDLKTEEPLAVIDGMKGIHGIAVVNEINKGFITDGKDNAVVVFDLTTFKIIKTIKISGDKPDAIMYDPFSKKILAFCGDSNNASVVDINSLTQTGTIDLGGAPEFAVSDGKGLVYNNLEDKSSLVVVDMKTMKVIHTYPLSPCGGPTGMALDEVNQRVFTACRENKGMSVVDINSGKVITTVPIGGGVDAVAYDQSSGLIICSNGDGTATIIKQESPDKYSVVQTLNTQQRAKTLAFDKSTRKLYLSAPQFEPGTRNIIPDSFAVLVYKQQ
ncbi:MAG: YncE family protein [Bacteroidota bacterium]|nr:YncE family protein [Bacteroidota bacterium]